MLCRPTFDRRSFIGAGAIGAVAMAFAPKMAFAKAETDKRFVFIIQRGAADGLGTVAPVGDPAFAGARGALAVDFEAAAKLAPHDPLARTAAAVGAFTKANPVKAFSRLGPLTGVFPRSAAVRFHLGLLLLWSGEQRKAVKQLRLAAADAPHSSYAQDARRLLSSLPGTRSK